MTESEKICLIKRINQRVADMTKGKTKLEYAAEKMREKITASIPSEYLTAKGNISHSKAAVKNISDETLLLLDKMPKKGDIIKDLKQKKAVEDGIDENDVTMEEVQKYADTVAEVRRIAEEQPHYLSDAINTVNPNFKGTKPTYEELKKAVNEFRTKYNEMASVNVKRIVKEYFGGDNA